MPFMSRNVIVLDAESEVDTGDCESSSSGGGDGVEQGEERSMLGRAVDAWLCPLMEARPVRSSNTVRTTEGEDEREFCEALEAWMMLGGAGPRRVLRGGRGGGSEGALSDDEGDRDEEGLLGPKSTPENADVTLALVFVLSRFR